MTAVVTKQYRGTYVAAGTAASYFADNNYLSVKEIFKFMVLIFSRNDLIFYLLGYNRGLYKHTTDRLPLKVRDDVD
jgi:hypothetical protein